MTKPNWEYVRVDVLILEHPKMSGANLAEISTEFIALLYCGRLQTDGHISEDAWQKIGTERARRRLQERGMIDPCPDHDGCHLMHDYLDHQRSRAEIAALKAARASAGARGGLAKALATRTPQHMPEQLPRSAASKNVAEQSRVDTPPAPPPITDTELAAVINTLRNRLHLTTTLAHARRVAADILKTAPRTPTDPAAYITAAITRNPTRYAPVEQPPSRDWAGERAAHNGTPPAHLADTLAAIRTGAQWNSPNSPPTSDTGQPNSHPSAENSPTYSEQ